MALIGGYLLFYGGRFCHGTSHFSVAYEITLTLN
jgi:hypothetical protein